MKTITDPVERLVATGLEAAGIAYEYEKNGLDFYLPSADLYIEVKRMHTPRIAEQMARAPNVIAIQGIAAARWLVVHILRSQADEPRVSTNLADEVQL